MLYSHSFEDDQFNYFISFINRVINNEVKYKDIVYPVLQDAHLLATGEKTPYNIDRDAFTIIIYLFDHDPVFFKELKIHDINNDTLKHVIELLSKSKDTLVSNE